MAITVPGKVINKSIEKAKRVLALYEKKMNIPSKNVHPYKNGRNIEIW